MSAVLLEQQINLYQPILGRQRRLFSARAILVALSLLSIALLSVAGYGARRIGRVEQDLLVLQRRQQASIEQAGRAGAALRPTLSLADLNAEGARLGQEIEVRQQAIAVMRENAANTGSSFAGRLDALARRQLAGLWLQRILINAGAGQLAMAGRATDARLIPAYLAALATEPALSGVRFDAIAIRRADPQQAPATSVFELDSPELSIKPDDKPDGTSP